MAAASRSSSEHGSTDAVAGGQRRKGSVGSSGSGTRGKRHAGDPTFAMTSRNADTVTSAPSPPPDGASRRGSKALASRGHKSSDRLHRLGSGGGSSTHLASKRSKSYTQVAQQGEGPRSGSGAGKSKKSKRRGPSQDARQNDEEGWTSASASGTPDQSIQPSPAHSGDEDDGEADEGLVIASKRSKAMNAPTHEETSKPPPGKATTTTTQDTTRREFPKIADGGVAPSASASSASTSSAANNATTSVPMRLTEHSRADSDDTLGRNSNSEAPTTPERGHSDTETPQRDQLSELRRPTPLRVGGHERVSSNASVRTLTGPNAYVDGSPASFSSRLSLRSRTLSLKPRDSLAAAPPMLSTENAMANSLAPADDAVISSSPVHLSRRQSRSEFNASAPEAWPSAEGSGRSRRQRESSIGSVGSFATLPNLDRDREAAGPSRLPTSTTDSCLAPVAQGKERQRTLSSQNTNSLTAADAAKLAAKLRQARDAMDEQQSIMTNSTGGAGASGLTSRVAALAHASSAVADGKYLKPIISTFSKDQERIGKPVAAAVTPKSVFAQGFTVAHQQSTDDKKQSPACHQIRYVARFGLSGPRMEKTSLNEALLAPSFDGDEFEASWAPALANAAGLGPRSSRFGHGMTSEAIEDGIPLHDPAMAFAGSAAVNGPNATPVHLIHGLTTISTDPFPLDATDTPTLEFDGESTTLTADPETLRAIALTSQMLSTHRSHTMTRRYHDPLYESIERCSRSGASSSAAIASRYYSTMGNDTSNSSASSNTLTPGSAAPQRRPVNNRRSQSHLAMSISSTDEDSGGAIKGIKRVWSGRGMSRLDSSSGASRR